MGVKTKSTEKETSAKAVKTSRLDLRLTEDQRHDFEEAASLSGIGISAWAVSRLTTAARDEIADSQRTVLPAAAFEEFLRTLEEPWPTPELDALRAKPRIWDTPEWNNIRLEARNER